MSAAVSFQNVPSMQIHLYILQANWNLYSKNRDYEYCNQHTLWASKPQRAHTHRPLLKETEERVLLSLVRFCWVCAYTPIPVPRALGDDAANCYAAHRTAVPAASHSRGRGVH